MNANRYLVICPGLFPESRPWVALETSDPAIAGSPPYPIVLTRVEAALDPDYAAAVAAWDAGDDREQQLDEQRARAVWDAGDVLREAQRGFSSLIEADRLLGRCATCGAAWDRGSSLDARCPNGCQSLAS